MPRAFTEEEVQHQVIKHFDKLVSYWNGDGNSNVPQEYSTRKRLEGLVHSMLAMFDGCTHLPMMHISLSPHPDDKEYCEKHNKNWYDEGLIINDTTLHEKWANRKKV